MKYNRDVRRTRCVILACGLIGAAMLPGACAAPDRAPFKADAAPQATLSAIEGHWRPMREGARVRELSIEREGRGWKVEIERLNEANQEIESEFPARILTIQGRTILEVEIARGRTGGTTNEPAAAFFYSVIQVDANQMRATPLDVQWLRDYTHRHPALKIAAVTPFGNERRTLGVGRAEGLRAMLNAAATDPKAWSDESLWVRADD